MRWKSLVTLVSAISILVALTTKVSATELETGTIPRLSSPVIEAVTFDSLGLTNPIHLAWDPVRKDLYVLDDYTIKRITFRMVNGWPEDPKVEEVANLWDIVPLLEEKDLANPRLLVHGISKVGDIAAYDGRIYLSWLIYRDNPCLYELGDNPTFHMVRYGEFYTGIFTWSNQGWQTLWLGPSGAAWMSSGFGEKLGITASGELVQRDDPTAVGENIFFYSDGGMNFHRLPRFALDKTNMALYMLIEHSPGYTPHYQLNERGKYERKECMSHQGETGVARIDLKEEPTFSILVEDIEKLPEQPLPSEPVTWIPPVTREFIRAYCSPGPTTYYFDYDGTYGISGDCANNRILIDEKNGILYMTDGNFRVYRYTEGYRPQHIATPRDRYETRALESSLYRPSKADRSLLFAWLKGDELWGADNNGVYRIVGLSSPVMRRTETILDWDKVQFIDARSHRPLEIPAITIDRRQGNIIHAEDEDLLVYAPQKEQVGMLVFFRMPPLDNRIAVRGDRADAVYLVDTPNAFEANPYINLAQISRLYVESIRPLSNKTWGGLDGRGVPIRFEPVEIINGQPYIRLDDLIASLRRWFDKELEYVYGPGVLFLTVPNRGPAGGWPRYFGVLTLARILPLF